MAERGKWLAFGKWQFYACARAPEAGVLLAPDGTPFAAYFFTPEKAREQAKRKLRIK